MDKQRKQIRPGAAGAGSAGAAAGLDKGPAAGAGREMERTAKGDGADDGPVSALEDPVAGKGMAIVFCAFIFILAAAFVLLPSREFSAQENRYLAQAPAPRWETIKSGQFMADIEEYITDQFPARDWWVSFKAQCQKLAGQKENNQVYNAADGYLIGVLAPVDAAAVEKSLSSIQALAKLGESLGEGGAPGDAASGGDSDGSGGAGGENPEKSLEGLRPFRTALLLAPTAGEVLRDKLPAHAYLPDQAQLLELARQRLGDIYLDIGPALKELNAAGGQVYYRTDHHWVTRAAYEGAAAYLAWLGLEPQPLAQYDVTAVTGEFYGTLWSKNSLPSIAPDSIEAYALRAGEPEISVTYYDGSAEETSDSLYAPSYLEGKDKYGYFLNGNKPLTVIRNLDWPGPRLLIFKDSYAHSLIPFLTPYFEEIHVVDLRYWRNDPIEYMKENQIDQVLFLYNAETFASDRTISQVGSYLSRYGVR